MTSNLRMIKCLILPRFEVEMLQDEEGRYIIRYVEQGEEYFSEYITDFGTASFMFDMKIQDLEGN